LTNGEARCWGQNKRGQNGSGTVSLETDTPRVVDGVHTAVAISAAAFHDCVLLAFGAAACWGYNDYGDLGANLVPGTYPTPQPVLFSPPFPTAAEPAAQPPSGSAPAGAEAAPAATPGDPAVQLTDPPPAGAVKPTCGSPRLRECGGGKHPHLPERAGR
jgi:hypothetical protein